MLTTLLVLAFFYVPIGILILNSFNSSRFGTTWQGFSLKWYGRLLERDDLWTALANSLKVAAFASIGAMILGTSAAFALHHYRSRLQKAHEILITMPLVVNRATFAYATVIVLTTALITALVVRRRLDHVDLVSALKQKD